MNYNISGMKNKVITLTKEELVDIVYEGFLNFCPSELDGGRLIDATQYADREDVNEWLEKERTKKNC